MCCCDILQLDIMRRLWQEEQQDKLLAEQQTDAVRQESARIWTELMRTEEVTVNKH
jgi:hypothetical protein